MKTLPENSVVKNAQSRMRIEVATRFDDVRREWEALWPHAVVSPYQSFGFLRAWQETIGVATGAAPWLIVIRDACGAPTALLPFCVYERMGVRIAQYLGGREANFNLPLLRQDAGHDEESLRAAMRAAASLTPKAPDIIFLRNQPRRFDDALNPLAFASAAPSASFAYGTTLPADPEELAARLSKDTRRKLRKKEARLAEIGELRYEHQARGERQLELLGALLQQKAARFPQLGAAAAFDRGALGLFLETLCNSDDHAGLELHALSAGGRVVATYAGVVAGKRFSAMLNSYDLNEEIARTSPGELLLHALMRHLVSRGITCFDLGAGEARYKKAVCDEAIELYDAVMPLSPRGVLAAPAFSAFIRLKRRVKQTPVLARSYYGIKGRIGFR